jgi:hypothetical protein
MLIYNRQPSLSWTVSGKIYAKKWWDDLEKLQAGTSKYLSLATRNIGFFYSQNKKGMANSP